MDTETPSRSLAARLRARPLLTGGLGVALVAVLAVVVFWFEPQALFIDDVVDEAFPTVEPENEEAADEPGDDEPGDDGSDDADATAAPADAGEGEAADPSEEVDASGDSEATAGAEDATGTEDETSDDDTGADGGGDGAETEDGDDAAAPEEPMGPVALAAGSFEGRNDYAVSGQATYYELEDGTRTLRFEDLEADNGPDLYVYLTSASSADSDADIDADAINLGVLKGNIGNQNYELPAEVDLERYDTVVIWCLRFTVGFGAADLIAP